MEVGGGLPAVMAAWHVSPGQWIPVRVRSALEFAIWHPFYFARKAKYVWHISIYCTGNMILSGDEWCTIAIWCRDIGYRHLHMIHRYLTPWHRQSPPTVHMLHRHLAPWHRLSPPTYDTSPFGAVASVIATYIWYSIFLQQSIHYLAPICMWWKERYQQMPPASRHNGPVLHGLRQLYRHRHCAAKTKGHVGLKSSYIATSLIPVIRLSLLNLLLGVFLTT